MIRYIWDIKDVKAIYESPDFKREEKIDLAYSDDKIFVNILERIQPGIGHNVSYKVKLFYSDGKTFEGWTSDMVFAISIMNEDELFDGRFNQ